MTPPTPLPEPRPGLDGLWDRLVGPGTTPAEAHWQFWGGMGLTAVLVYVMFTHQPALAWSGWQWAVAVLLAFDLSGGILTNSTASAKRWYHREGVTAVYHFSFVAFHLLEILLVVWLFRAWDWRYFAVVSGYLLGAAFLILRTPFVLQRTAAFLALAGGILLHQYFLTPTPGLEWFVPFLYFKLLVSHLLKES